MLGLNKEVNSLIHLTKNVFWQADPVETYGLNLTQATPGSDVQVSAGLRSYNVFHGSQLSVSFDGTQQPKNKSYFTING